MASVDVHTFVMEPIWNTESVVAATPVARLSTPAACSITSAPTATAMAAAGRCSWPGWPGNVRSTSRRYHPASAWADHRSPVEPRIRTGRQGRAGPAIRADERGSGTDRDADLDPPPRPGTGLANDAARDSPCGRSIRPKTPSRGGTRRDPSDDQPERSLAVVDLSGGHQPAIAGLSVSKDMHEVVPGEIVRYGRNGISRSRYWRFTG